MKISARNKLKGRIVEVNKGATSSRLQSPMNRLKN
jgi:molybdopterin-binding protein